MSVTLWRSALLLLLAATLLHGCGWHLRGSGDLALPIESTAIVGAGGEPLLRRDLRRALEEAHVLVMEEAAKAATTIELGEVKIQRRPVAIDRTGRVEEYELSYRVTMALQDAQGKVLLEERPIEVIRTLSYDANLILAKEREQELLMREMRSDVVRAVLYRLRSLALKPTP